MKKNKFILHPVVNILIIAIILVWYAYQFERHWFVNFLETYISIDGNITNEHLAITKIYFTLIYLILFWYIAIEQIKRKLFWQNLLTRLRVKDKIVYSFAFILIFLWIFFNNSKFLYNEGFLEYLTAFFLLYSSSYVVYFLTKNKSYLNNKIYFIGIGIFLFIVGMEEISWGQTIFNWSTPKFITEINIQNETNIHNIFNPFFPIAYPLFCFVMGYTLSNIEYIKDQWGNSKLLNNAVKVLPSIEFSYWGILFLLLGFLTILPNGAGELTEELFSLFSFAYVMDFSNLFSKITDQHQI